MTICAAFLPFRLVYGYSLRLLFPLFPRTPRLSVVKYVVKKPLSEHPRDRSQKAVFHSLAECCGQVIRYPGLPHCTSAGEVKQAFYADKRRRICVAIDKEYTQQPLRSPNSGGVLRESAPEVRKSICALREKRC